MDGRVCGCEDSDHQPTKCSVGVCTSPKNQTTKMIFLCFFFHQGNFDCFMHEKLKTGEYLELFSFPRKQVWENLMKNFKKINWIFFGFLTESHSRKSFNNFKLSISVNVCHQLIINKSSKNFLFSFYFTLIYQSFFQFVSSSIVFLKNGIRSTI